MNFGVEGNYKSKICKLATKVARIENFLNRKNKVFAGPKHKVFVGFISFLKFLKIL